MTGKLLLRSALAAGFFLLVGVEISLAAQVSKLTVEPNDRGGAPVVRSVRRENVESLETIRARENETVEILFSDGTSVTIARGGQVQIEKYEYDPATRRGRLALRVSSGLVRVIGGVLNNTAEIDVALSGGSVAIDNGVAYFEAGDGSSKFVLGAGRALRVASDSGKATTLATQQVGSLEGDGGFSFGAARTPDVVRGYALAMNPGLTTGAVPVFVADREFQDAPDEEEAQSENFEGQSKGTKAAAEALQVSEVSLSPAPAACPGCLVNIFNQFPSTVSAGDVPTISGNETGGANWDLDTSQTGRDDSFLSDGRRNTTTRDFDLSFSRTLYPGGVEGRDGNYEWVTFVPEGESNPRLLHVREVSLPSPRRHPSYSIGRSFLYESSSDGSPQSRLGVRTFVSDYENLLEVNGVVGEDDDANGFIDDFGYPDPSTEDGNIALDGSAYGLSDVAILQTPDLVGSVDSFLAIESLQRLGWEQEIATDDGVVRAREELKPVRTFFATGSVAGTGNQVDRVVDSFAIRPGLLNWTTSERAFVRPVVNPYPLYSSPLQILTDSYFGPVSEGRALHFDFGTSGQGRDQRSTISVTLAEIDYATGATTSAQLRGRTVGSVSDGAASLAVQSPIFSTAAGAGNSNPDLASFQGRAQYLVLENFDEGISATGGRERPVSGADGENYAFLRVAEATASIPATSAPVRQLGGYIKGFLQQDGTTTLNIATASNLVIDLNGGDVGATATLLFAGGREAGGRNASVQLGSRGAPGLLGVQTGVHEFAAMSEAAPILTSDLTSNTHETPASAIVSGRPDIVDGWDGLDDDAADAANALRRSYNHLEWGFFFGDVDGLDANEDSERLHGHLLSFAAGSPTDPANVPMSGQVSYSGHVLANVFTSDGTIANSNTYTAAGTITNQWDFGRRTGSGDINLDNQRYVIQTQLPAASSTFTGRIVDDGFQNGRLPTRTGTLNGKFVGGAAEGMVGEFGIGTSGPATVATPSYTAVGTFGAEQ